MSAVSGKTIDLLGVALGSKTAARELSDKVKTSIQKDGSSTFDADQSMGGHRVTSLAEPIESSDAVTKNYVDAQVMGSAPRGVEYITLTSQQLEAGFVILQNVPLSSSRIEVTVVGGVSQLFETDFTVNGRNLSWVGLGLETILEVGDTLLISYDY
jgi:hypothetical protein